VREGIRAFYQGFAEAGFVEGRNVTIEHRSPEDHNDRMPALAAELVRRNVAVIVADTTMVRGSPRRGRPCVPQAPGATGGRYTAVSRLMQTEQITTSVAREWETMDEQEHLKRLQQAVL
jgi:hypothetical protein